MEFTESLKKTFEFRTVYKKGKYYADSNLVIYILKNSKEINRLGITVSKKVGNSVVRSRVTRLIRESYRLNEKKFKKGYDIVIVGRSNAKEKKCENISKSLIYLSKKHSVLK